MTVITLAQPSEMMFIDILLGLVLVGLGMIHFYWVFGGNFGFVASLPTNESGKRVLNPKKIHSAIVGLGLTVFGLFYLLNSGIVNFTLPDWAVLYGGWIIPVIFLLRALGDFRYIGFFKSVNKTDFGKLDTKFFSPLCFAIAICGIIIQLMK